MSVLHLQFTRPDGETETYHLKGIRPYTIGRGSQCEIRILDMKMSRQHCQLQEDAEGWKAADLGSTNGVQVNGIKIGEATRLEAGMRLNMGLSELTVANINHSLELDAEDLVDSDFDQPLVDKAMTPDLAQAETASLQRNPEQPLVEQDAMPEVDDDVPTVVPDNAWEPEPHNDETGENEAVLIPTTARHRLAESKGITSTEAIMREDPGRKREGDARNLTQHFIKLLGRRFGPLTREQARTLKAKELKGDLADADLKDLPEA